MAKKQLTGNVWYAIKGIVSPILLLIMVSLGFSSESAEMASTLGGMYLILWGLNCLTVTNTYSIVAGIALFVGGGLLMGLDIGKNEWFLHVTTALTFLLIAYIGFRQRKKLREPYCKGTVYEKHQKILSRVICFGIMIGGALVFVSSLLNIPASTKKLAVTSILRIIGSIGVFAGTISWVAYTFLVLKALKLNGRTINSYRSGSSRKSSTSSSMHATSGGASPEEVERAMTSVAKSFRGDWDMTLYDCKISYDVDVTITDDIGLKSGDIKFVLYCSVSGSYEERYEETVKSAVSEKIKKKQNKIMDKAKERLEEIKPAYNYLISVDVQTR